jgi:chemotaxis protein MotB
VARSRRQGTQGGSANIWPGFVDALATLLLAIIFLLVIFVLAQVIMSRAITGKDAALEELNQQVAELADLLDLEQSANADLRLNIAELSSSLQSSADNRDEFADRVDDLEAKNRAAQMALALSNEEAAEREEALKQNLLEVASLKDDILALREIREELEAEVGQLANALDASKESLEKLTVENSAARDRTKKLQAELSTAQERTRLAQVEIDAREIRLAELSGIYGALKEKYDETLELTQTQQNQVALLNQQIAALRRQIGILNQTLEASEAKDIDQQATIRDLGKRLNKALASKVAELARYRSEFFGRLREVLGKRADIQIVGDRFVFQSEVLFVSGSAVLEPAGEDQLIRLADTLIDISSEIPDELNWVLRIDGHTDRDPIRTFEFPSNWELSSARAISVVKFLMIRGVPADRLVAAGFGEHQPLIDEDTDKAKERNRRIEFKLTQR